MNGSADKAGHFFFFWEGRPGDEGMPEMFTNYSILFSFLSMMNGLHFMYNL